MRTASQMQVREPVYRRSIGSWRRYAEFLEPLAQALGLDIRAMLANGDPPSAATAMPVAPTTSRRSPVIAASNMD